MVVTRDVQVRSTENVVTYTEEVPPRSPRLVSTMLASTDLHSLFLPLIYIRLLVF